MRKSNKFIILLCLVFFFRCSNSTDPNILALVGSTHVTTDEFVDAYSNKLIQNQIKDSDFERDREGEIVFLFQNECLCIINPLYSK